MDVEALAIGKNAHGTLRKDMMKISNLPLGGSLLSNIALLALVLLGPDQGTTANLGLTTQRHSQAESSLAEKALSGTAKSPATTDLWSLLQTDDPFELVKRLRAAGFPREEISSVVMALVSRKQDAARIGLVGRREDIPYWKTSFASAFDDPKKRAKLMELYADESKLFRKLFPSSEEIEENPEAALHARRRFGNFSTEKLKQLTKIEEDYSELSEDVFMRHSGSGDLTPTEREKLTLLQSEQERDIQQTLTAEEYADYQLRNSGTARNMRTQLQLFQPTEAEYKSLFALRSTVDQQFKSWNRDAEGSRAYREAMEKLRPQIEAALGAERYADYIQATEQGSDKLSRLMVRLNLPLATAGKVTAVREDISQRAEAIRNDAQIDSTERTSRLAALAEEAKTKLTTTLGGARGYNAYEDIKGDWIRTLQKSPPATATPWSPL